MKLKNIRITSPFSIVRANGKIYSLTRGAKIRYCSCYGLDDFDDAGFEHIEKNMQNGKFYNGKCKCPEMIMTVRENRIVSIKINLENYVGIRGER